METKEIAMLKRTTLLGTAFVLTTALAAGPAAADQLQGFQGFGSAEYGHSGFSDCSGCQDLNTGTFGVGMALPLADLPNLNWQIDGSYSHQWTDGNHCDGAEGGCGHSQEVWNFGFSPFWAGPQSRFGLDLAYETVTHFGHRTNGGAFMEWYWNDAFTVSAKGGYLSDGGARNGGHGHYIAGALTFYGTPDLAVSATIDWQDVVSGFGCSFGRPCIRGDVSGVTFGIDAEFLPWEDLGLAVFGGINFNTTSQPNVLPGGDFKATLFNIGLRYYTGVAAGSLENRHRNGQLHDWLRGP
jgi:hypothetical protein